MPYKIEDYRQSAEYIRSKIEKIPDLAIVLGSGLGNLVNEIEKPVIIDYNDIPTFPKPTVKSHEGRLYCGKLGGRDVMVFSGRSHYYEGCSMEQVTYYVRILQMLCVKQLIITNAAGAINEDYSPGDFMLISDHLSFMCQSPARGKHIPEFGERFFDMTRVYDAGMREKAKKAGKKSGINLREGIYAYMSGPQYETPSEIKALRLLGADAVGMSTVPEVIIAAQCGIEVLGISYITNMAAGMTGKVLSHAEVMRESERISDVFAALIRNTVSEL